MLNEETSPQTHAVIGACLKVHQEFGPGFLETAYHEALAIEFRKQGIPFRHEAPLPLFYCGERLVTVYRTDFIAFQDLLLELKAVSSLGRVEEAQVLHYLKATGCSTGLLINFGAISLQIRRLTYRPKASEGLESPVSP